MKNKSFKKNDEKGVQSLNKKWWEDNPMTYDWEVNNKVDSDLDKKWFDRVDNEFWHISSEFAHPKYPKVEPFSELINYNSLKGKKVLEIGCGMGSHSSILSKFAKELKTIDLTQTAVDTTNERFRLFNINNAEAINADAENIPFDDETFDFVWSWGVIHHSVNTEKIVDEIYRVLKKGGKSTIMIYNKNSTRYYIHGLYQGIFKLKFLKYKSLYDVNMTFTDGYIAKHYTKKTAKKLFHKFKIDKIFVRDCGIPSVVFGWGRISKIFPFIFNKINKWINFNWGWFLIINISK